LLEVERRRLYTKFGITSLEEFDYLLIEHPDEESNLLEDFQRADYLTHRINEISNWIKELNSAN